MCYAFVMGLFFAVVIYITDNLTVSDSTSYVV
ncbi:MAG: hypothetical protein ACLVIY_05720 [Anaerobutyricum soehngenii]